MIYFLTLIGGGIGGFLLHSLTMKVNFKQKTIENKIKVYDALISHWVRMRNIIFSAHPIDASQFDQIYGESQSLVGECFLVSDDSELSEEINNMGEKLYRAEWAGMTPEDCAKRIQEIKVEGIKLIIKMREDIKDSTRFDLKDFFHILKGFKK